MRAVGRRIELGQEPAADPGHEAAGLSGCDELGYAWQAEEHAEEQPEHAADTGEEDQASDEEREAQYRRCEDTTTSSCRRELHRQSHRRPPRLALAHGAIDPKWQTGHEPVIDFPLGRDMDAASRGVPGEIERDDTPESRDDIIRRPSRGAEDLAVADDGPCPPSGSGCGGPWR